MRIIITREEICRAIRDQLLNQTIIASGSTFEFVFNDDALEYPIDNLQATVDINIVDERPRIEITRRPQLMPKFIEVGNVTAGPPGGETTSAEDAAEQGRRGRGRPPGAKNKPKTDDTAEATEAQEEAPAAEAIDVAETAEKAPEPSAVARVSPFAKVLAKAAEPVDEPVAEPAILQGGGVIQNISTGEERVEPDTNHEALSEVAPPVVKRSLFASIARREEPADEGPAEQTALNPADINTDDPAQAEEEAPKSPSKSLFANLKAINNKPS